MRYFEEAIALKEDPCDAQGRHVLFYFNHHIVFHSKHNIVVLDAWAWTTDKYPDTIVSFVEKAPALKLKMSFEW